MSNPTISGSRVTGTAVFNAEGQKLGSIDDLIIDKRSGLVRFATLASGGFLGLGSEHRSIPWTGLTYDTGLAGYVVALPRSQGDVAAAPEAQHERGHRVEDFFGEKSI